MGLVTREMAIGSHAWFVRSGDAFTTPAPGVAGVAALPDPNDNSWLPLGDVEDWEDSMSEDEKPVYAPAPGHLVRKRIITTKQDLDFKLTVNQVSALVFECFYRSTQKLNANSFQFNPLSAVPREGWLKLQRYSDEDVLIFSADLWVQLKVTGGMKGGGGNIVLPEFKAALLYSALNTCALGSQA